MTAHAPHPAVLARGRRRVRAIVATVLWCLVVALVALTGVLVISGLWSMDLTRALAAPAEALRTAGVRLPQWMVELTGGSPLLLPILALLVVVVAIGVVAAIVAPTSPVRRVLAPIVLAGAAVPTWFGATQVVLSLVRFQPELLATGAMLLGLGLAGAALAAWTGLGSRAGGLAAVPIVAFFTVLLPLAAIAVLAFQDEGQSVFSGPGRLIMSLHWVQSLVVILCAVLACVIVARSATYRPG